MCTKGHTEAIAREYVTQTNANLLQITSTGITILVSSGDAGAHGRTDESCISKKTRADWPGSSPYVLAVGGTQVRAGAAGAGAAGGARGATLALLSVSPSSSSAACS